MGQKTERSKRSVWEVEKNQCWETLNEFSCQLRIAGILEVFWLNNAQFFHAPMPTTHSHALTRTHTHSHTLTRTHMDPPPSRTRTLVNACRLKNPSQTHGRIKFPYACRKFEKQRLEIFMRNESKVEIQLKKVKIESVSLNWTDKPVIRQSPVRCNSGWLSRDLTQNSHPKWETAACVKKTQSLHFYDFCDLFAPDSA